MKRNDERQPTTNGVTSHEANLSTRILPAPLWAVQVLHTLYFHVVSIRSHGIVEEARFIENRLLAVDTAATAADLWP